VLRARAGWLWLGRRGLRRAAGWARTARARLRRGPGAGRYPPPRVFPGAAGGLPPAPTKSEGPLSRACRHRRSRRTASRIHWVRSCRHVQVRGSMFGSGAGRDLSCVEMTRVGVRHPGPCCPANEILHLRVQDDRERWMTPQTWLVRDEILPQAQDDTRGRLPPQSVVAAGRDPSFLRMTSESGRRLEAGRCRDEGWQGRTARHPEVGGKRVFQPCRSPDERK
jgi:hypothetical protein